MAQINFGNLLRNYLERKEISKKELIKKSGLYPSTIYNYLNNPHIRTDSLLRISHALKHNFFMDMALQLPKEYEIKKEVPLYEQIKQLKKEIEKLKIQNETLKEVLRSR